MNFKRCCPGNFLFNFKPLKIEIEALIHSLTPKKIYIYILQTLSTSPHLGQNKNEKRKSARVSVLVTVLYQIISSNQSQQIPLFFLVIIAEFTTG